MLSASIEFRNKIAENSKVLVKATLKLAGGRSVELTGDDIVMSGLSFTEATSSSDSFDIGGLVIGKLVCTLNNFDGRFDDYDFTGATISPSIGMPLDDGSTEWIRKGVYNIDQPASYGGTISLDCFDNLTKLDKPYSDVKTVFPASAMVVVSDIARACDLTLITSAFNNDSIQFDARPEDENLTCRQVLAYALQATCNYGKCDQNGRLVIDWYDKNAWTHEQTLDGKWFDEASPYASGDTADGGNFTNYGSGASYEGGDFSVNYAYAIVSALSTQTIGLDDVVITGLKVTSTENPDEDAEDDQKYETYQFGADGYVLEIKDNPFIPYGQAIRFAQAIGPNVVNLRFRIFDVQAVGTPVNEAGDPILIIDGASRQYRSYITQLTYKPGAYESYSCAGETPLRRSAASYGSIAQAVSQFDKKIKREKSAREAAQEDLAKRLAESSGLYMTAKKQDDNSTIYYAHDKPTLEGSKIVWKITAEAIGFSTDGGKSYPYGLDVDGNTILNRIYTIGLDASYITAGRIKAQKGDNFWDLETGELRMAFDGIQDSTGKKLSEVIAALEKTDADNFKELQDIASDGIVTESEKRAIDVMLKRIQAERVEAVNLYTTVYGNSNLTGTPKTNLYNAKVALYGTSGTDGSYGNLVTAINNVKNATTQSAVTSAMSTYNTRYSSYQSNRNTFTSALQAAQLAIDTKVAEVKADAAVDGQTQKDIFDKLTNGSANQGLYLSGSNLYVNATYIKTGTITDNKGYNYWNLTTGEFRLSPSNTKVGSSTSSQTLDAYISGKTTDSFANATPQQVFNKLTNNGTVKGITLTNGNLYINADYIGSGTISGNSGNSTWNLNTGVFQNKTRQTIGGQQHDNYLKINGVTLEFVMDVTRVGLLYCGTSSTDPDYHNMVLMSYSDLILSSPMSLGVANAYPSSTSLGTWTAGRSKTITYLTNVQYSGNPTVTARLNTGTTYRFALCDGSGNVTQYLDWAIPTSVSVSVTVPGLSKSTQSIVFTKGLMSTS